MAQVYDIPLVLPIHSSNEFQTEMSTAKTHSAIYPPAFQPVTNTILQLILVQSWIPTFPFTFSPAGFSIVWVFSNTSAKLNWCFYKALCSIRSIILYQLKFISQNITNLWRCRLCSINCLLITGDQGHAHRWLMCLELGHVNCKTWGIPVFLTVSRGSSDASLSLTSFPFRSAAFGFRHLARSWIIATN